MPEPTDQGDLLDTLAAEFVERHRRGEVPTVDEYAEAHPELAEDIRNLFPTIAAVERLKTHSERTEGGLASLGPDRLERLGEFRILREIGRGGMGIVYEAEQESLSRPVAIKVLPRQSLLDEKHLRRFEREARIAAGLHHTNIVQVYGVGQWEGFHYYVMQLVRGVGLDRVASHLTGDEGDARVERICRRLFGPAGRGARFWRGAARIGIQAAEALDYAHAQGALHRDIKPGNLLADEDGIVWVVDFGLARAGGAGNVTQGSDLTGTLQYMAPEQFAGQSGAAGDIYSLGVTLYELLVGRPAYDDTDRSQLIHRITQGDLPRPRAIDPCIPRDLETIVLKALSREPDRRYATAGELAADLQRFGEDRPILARRAGPAERLIRWCRRNPAVASLTAAVFLLAVLVAVVASVGYVRTRRALDSEAAQRAQAQANADLALETLDRVFERFAPRSGPGMSELALGGAGGPSVEITDPPPLSPEAAALLEGMLPFYDRLAAQTGDEDVVRRKIADANRRLGDIRQRLGQYEQAIAAYRRAVDIYESLSATPVTVAAALNELGALQRVLRRTAEAQQAHQQALDLLSKAATASARFELARTCFFLGTKPRPEPGARPAGPDRPAEAGPEQPYLDRAIALLDALVEEHPTSGDYRHLLALCYRDRRGGRGGVKGGPPKALEILEQLVRDFPDAPDYRYDLSETYAKVNLHRPLPRESDESPEQRLRKALVVSEKLVAEHPNIPRYALSRAQILNKLAAVLRRAQRLDEALSYDRQAVAVTSALAERFPDVVSYRVWLGSFRNSLADLLSRRDRFDEARTEAEQTAAMLESLLSEHPEMWFLHGLLDRSYATLASVLRREGKRGPADAADTRAREHRGQMPTSDRPTDPPPRRRGRE